MAFVVLLIPSIIKYQVSEVGFSYNPLCLPVFEAFRARHATSSSFKFNSTIIGVKDRNTLWQANNVRQ